MNHKDCGFEIKEVKSSGTFRGTTVMFTQKFSAITSITLTPQSITNNVAHTLIYDLAENPVGFKAYLYNAAGARVKDTMRWSVRGYKGEML
jgi:hypothetical protein